MPSKQKRLTLPGRRCSRSPLEPGVGDLREPVNELVPRVVMWAALRSRLALASSSGGQSRDPGQVLGTSPAVALPVRRPH